MAAPSPSPSGPVGVAVVGAGYWGPNLIRNFVGSPATTLRWVCDLDVDRAGAVAGPYRDVAVTDDLDTVLDDPAVEAIALATPAATHHPLALRALAAGKHLLVEKPLATRSDHARELVEAARERELVLMCDHTFCYTPVVQRIRETVHSGALGSLHYFDSVRVNLGLVQPDTNVFWDLAPHDLSILDFVLPPRVRITGIAAHGADPMRTGQACVGYLAMPLSNGGIAHVHVNWLSPTKIRTTVLGGSHRTIVWDDVNPAQRLSIFDRGIELTPDATGTDRADVFVSYRLGDVLAPALPEREALGAVVTELATAIRQRRAPLTDGEAGLRTLLLLEAAERSLAEAGARQEV